MKKQISAITSMVADIYNYIAKKPDCEASDLLEELKISRRTFYSCLMGLQDEQIICNGEVFRVREEGESLTVTIVESYLHNENKDHKPKKAERILYLYNLLHRNIPYGGANIDDIIKQYITLLEHSFNEIPKIESVRRMIYRDLDELEKIGIIIERPSTGSPKYCLRDKYLPKLPFEQASSLYVSMLLFEDTILDQMSSSAKEEFEKAFFKNSPDESAKINNRIHVVADTLVNPVEFGDRFTKLVTAVINCYQVRIIYGKLDGEVSKRLLKPLGLVFKRGVWYLVADNDEGKEYRTFRIDQIIDVYLMSSQFIYPQEFSLAEHIGSSWGVYTNDGVETIILKFSPTVAFRIKNLRYHRSQKIIEELPDGSVILSLQVCGLIELKSWLLQWGKEVEVLEPFHLRRELRAAALEIANIYN